MIKQSSKTDILFKDESKLVQLIRTETDRCNLDNISRTDVYFQFYRQHKEIHWSFLASMVSRNAGWNMCDLQGNWFPYLIQKKMREQLFLTYERANWLIFQDVYPQLLLYHYSTKVKQSMFHLLKVFHVSSFMEKEWNYFWERRDHRRLLLSLIINEQNVIQLPVICHPLYQKNVFRSIAFSIQDWFHFSSVLFPTCDGRLYGASVNGFKKINKRIDLGKRLADILFAEHLYPYFYEFASMTVHTGSRYDYERYFMTNIKRDTPYLRMAYPVIIHHVHEYKDWSMKRKVEKKWYDHPAHIHPLLLTEWFKHKQNQLKKTIFLKQLIIE